MIDTCYSHAHDHHMLLLMPTCIQVDGTASKVLLMRFGVAAYPSIFLLREGKTYNYEGNRDVGSVGLWHTQQPPSACAL